MHPLIPAVVGSVVGAIIYLFAAGGAKETYERIAVVAGCVGAILCGVALVWAGVPAVDTSAAGAAKRVMGLAACGLSSFLASANFAIVAQSGSGGFSSTRTNAMIGTVVFVIVLAVCAGAVRG